MFARYVHQTYGQIDGSLGESEFSWSGAAPNEASEAVEAALCLKAGRSKDVSARLDLVALKAITHIVVQGDDRRPQCVRADKQAKRIADELKPGLLHTGARLSEDEVAEVQLYYGDAEISVQF